jgi:molybdate transport system ATP-binding protein
MDEPFSALDPATKLRMYGMMERAHEDIGCTIMLVTHDFNEAQALADRVAIVLGGRLWAVVPAAELFDAEYDPEVEQFLGIR